MPMRTPREILLRRHQAASPKLDAIRAEVVARVARPCAPETMSWREMALSLRWHLAAMSAAWVVVVLLNMDHSGNAAATVPSAAIPEPRQIWSSLREHRRLLLQYSDAPAVEPPAVPGRRTDIKPRQAEV
jgi:hypothetical protein